MPLALAIDVGGTKLAAGLVTRTGQILTAAKVPTAPLARGSADDLSADDLFERVVDLARSVLADASDDVLVCGVGCGGPMTPGGEAVSPLNVPAWRDFPLRARLAASLGLPVFVDNDAKALALGEGWVGAAAGERHFIAMVVSTGIGGGIVLDGRLLDGKSGNAGHIGHVVVEPDGRRCACGGRGCLEAEASGPSIEAATGIPPETAGPDVVRRTGMLVGRAVASVANLLDLRLAVVAGSVALGFGAEFFAAAQAEVDARAKLSFSSGTRIVPAGLGADGPLVGAAAVGLRGADALPGGTTLG